MAARRSEKIFLNNNSTTTEASPDEGPDETRVPSFSPTHPDPGAVDAERNGEVFISPRVVDQQSFDELATSLRSLIDESNGAAQRLQTLVEQGKDGDAWASKASEHLQDRLRLSARMLKAFQSQITRVETAVNSLDEREHILEQSRTVLDDSLNEFETHLCDVLERFEGRVNAITDRAVERAAQRLTERGEELNQLENRITEATRRAEASVSVVEEVESVIAPLAHHTAALGRSVESRHEQVEAIIETTITELTTRIQSVGSLITRGDEATASLAGELARAEDRLEQASVRCRGIRCSLETKLDQCREAELQFDSRFKEVFEIVQSLDVDQESYEKLQTLLTRLEPWREVVLCEEGPSAGLPETMATVVNELRDGVGRDLRALSRVMNDVAQKINDSRLIGGLAAVTTELKPDASPANPEVEPSVEETLSDISGQATTEDSPVSDGASSP